MAQVQQKRDPVLDMVRGWGITLVVVGHSGAPFTNWIYLFHVPLFFVLSGYLFRPAHSDTAAGLARYARGRLRALWLPFVLYNTAFTVLQNLFLRLHLLAAEPVTLRDIAGRTLHWMVFDGGTQLGGALWFVQVLFQVSLLYAAVDWLAKKTAGRHSVWVQGAVSVLLLGVGWYCQRRQLGVWQLDTAASSYCLFYLGTLLRRLPLARLRPAQQAAAGAAAFAVLTVCGQLGGISLAANYYRDPLLLLVCAAAGWMMSYALAALLCPLAPARAALCTLGRHSMAIMALQFLAFKAVSWAGICLARPPLPAKQLASFPVLFTGGGWWAAYSAAGLALPLAGALLAQAIKEHFRK